MACQTSDVACGASIMLGAAHPSYQSIMWCVAMLVLAHHEVLPPHERTLSRRARGSRRWPRQNVALTRTGSWSTTHNVRTTFQRSCAYTYTRRATPTSAWSRTGFAPLSARTPSSSSKLMINTDSAPACSISRPKRLSPQSLRRCHAEVGHFVDELGQCGGEPCIVQTWPSVFRIACANPSNQKRTESTHEEKLSNGKRKQKPSRKPKPRLQRSSPQMVRRMRFRRRRVQL